MVSRRSTWFMSITQTEGRKCSTWFFLGICIGLGLSTLLYLKRRPPAYQFVFLAPSIARSELSQPRTRINVLQHSNPLLNRQGTNSHLESLATKFEANFSSQRNSENPARNRTIQQAPASSASKNKNQKPSVRLYQYLTLSHDLNQTLHTLKGLPHAHVRFIVGFWGGPLQPLYLKILKANLCYLAKQQRETGGEFELTMIKLPTLFNACGGSGQGLFMCLNYFYRALFDVSDFLVTWCGDCFIMEHRVPFYSTFIEPYVSSHYDLWLTDHSCALNNAGRIYSNYKQSKKSTNAARVLLDRDVEIIPARTTWPFTDNGVFVGALCSVIRQAYLEAYPRSSNLPCSHTALPNSADFLSEAERCCISKAFGEWQPGASRSWNFSIRHSRCYSNDAKACSLSFDHIHGHVLLLNPRKGLVSYVGDYPCWHKSVSFKLGDFAIHTKWRQESALQGEMDQRQKRFAESCVIEGWRNDGQFQPGC